MNTKFFGNLRARITRQLSSFLSSAQKTKAPDAHKAITSTTSLDRFLNRKNIKFKVFSGPILALSSLLICSAIAFVGSMRTDQDLTQAGQTTYPALKSLYSLKEQSKAIENSLAQAITDQDEFLVEDTAALNTKLIEQINTLPVTSNKKELLETWNAYYSYSNKVILQFIRQEIESDAFATSAPEIRASWDKFKSLLDKEVNRYEEDLQTDLQNTISHNQSTSNLLIGLSLALVFLISWLSYRVANNMIRALSQLKQDFDALNQGNLQHTISVHSQDEIGQMAQTAKELSQTLKQTVLEATHVMQNVSQGNYDARMAQELPGDFNALKENINNGTNRLGQMSDTLQETIQKIGQGQLSARMDQRAPEKLRDTFNQSLEVLNQTFANLEKGLKDVAKGNFSARVQGQYQGDYEKLKNSTNEALSMLEQGVSSIQKISVELSNRNLTYRNSTPLSGDLKTLNDSLEQAMSAIQGTLKKAILSADEVEAGSREIASGNQDLSNRTERQAIALDQSASNMTEMLAQLEQITENNKQTTALTQKTSEQSMRGETIATQAKSAMEDIEKSSKKIQDIVSLIDNISFQTNILALNAAVEAARAGEHGKGFAVVASEVRSLSQKTSESAKEIRKLIEQMRQLVTDGKKLVIESGTSFSDVAKSNKTIENLAQSGLEDLQQQFQALKSISSSIDQITSNNQQNSSMVEEVAAAAKALTEQAEILKNNISTFKI